MRALLLVGILAFLYTACSETKQQILEDEKDYTPSEKTIWQPEQK
ncbi:MULTISPECIES: hypothetical protein [Helicobacter]|uniref:Uncharacterized protein n=2 Tax=Helicobacter TaxID=209 RepID=A0A0K2XUK8_HELHE|nr:MULTISPECIES: hypothetical protein [Helicobacter]CCM11643.1 hypothetical protein BN341_19450 [Helicobacter heilmannii ASB1.4]CRF45745.1 putative [Helicobacter heilmannii]CRF50801.1 putative [Helicobacter heilmannii]CRI33783.1 hypothetical protein HHE01_14690 [Helicobacter heilmannii]BCZ19525.1 Putative lipoprotein [Helicobacter sp. NHP19-012]